MKRRIKYSLFLLIILITACHSHQKTEGSILQNESGFPRGELLNSPNFTGKVWLQMMGANDSTLNTRYGNVTFEPGARTNWHSHPGGQILFITEGQGYYQALGQPARLVYKGDVVEIPRNVVHWHGATAKNQFAHIAISLNTDEGEVKWLDPLAEEEYTTLK